MGNDSVISTRGSSALELSCLRAGDRNYLENVKYLSISEIRDELVELAGGNCLRIPKGVGSPGFHVERLCPEAARSVYNIRRPTVQTPDES